MQGKHSQLKDDTHMIHSLKAKLKDKFSDELRFFSGLKKQPKTVGAIWPTGKVMARSMARIVNIDTKLPVLELGPGTGVITKAILARGLDPKKLHAIEYSPQFVQELRHIFPDIHVHEGDAFNLQESVGDMQFDCAISALPLLNFPMRMRIKFINDVLARLPYGRPLIQFSYSPIPSVAARPDEFTIKHHDFVFRNIPPARIFAYRKV
jgi:phosphatidylethanolamine/phosphatidyl-N-methylethanolamine N-methyltransferase